MPMDIMELAIEYRALERELQLTNPVMEDGARGEYGVLLYLLKCRDGMLSGELSRMLRLSSGRMSTILKSLENKNWIVRSCDAEDKRYVRVRLTKQGEVEANRIDKNSNEKVISLLEKLGEKDAKDLIRLKRKIIEILRESKE